MYNNRGYRLRRWDVEDDIARAQAEWGNGNTYLALHKLDVAERVANIWHFNDLLREIAELRQEINETLFFITAGAGLDSH